MLSSLGTEWKEQAPGWEQWCMPVTQEVDRQVELWEFLARLLYIVSSRTTRAT